MQMNNEIKRGRINLHYFGETGSYDKYCPVFVCGKDHVPEIVHLIASSQPCTLSKGDIPGRLNIGVEQVEEAIIGLIRIGAIEELGPTYKMCFPVFLEQDLLLIDKYLSPAGEISDSFLQLAEATGVDTTQEDTFRVFFYFAAAIWAFGWRLKRFCPFWPAVFFDLDDLRYDFARFFDNDGIALADIEAGYLVEVVQTRPFDGCPRQ